MTEQFIITLLNMSFTAAVMAVIVLVIRLFIRRLPKWYSYALWGLVFFRLLCPVSIASPFSLFPASQPINRQIVYAEVPSIHSGILLIDRPINWVLEQTMTVKAKYTSMNPIQYVFYTFLIIWGIGLILFLSVNLLLYIRMKLRLRTAVLIEPGVMESDRIAMPMVLGIFRPVIYLPCGIEKEEEKCILLHERMHIKRRDHLVKPLGFLALAIHWFNPFAWVAFTKMCGDMEMSCDEKVLNELGTDRRTDYSMVLLQFSARKSGLLIPLAFGESHTKSRIKNILHCKKPVFFISTAAVVLLVCAAVAFLTNPPASSKSISIIGGADGPTSIFIAGKTAGEVHTIEAVPVNQEEAADILMKKRTGAFEAGGGEINLDFASDDRIVLHGSFGVCVYERQNGRWSMTGSVNMGMVDERYHDNAYLLRIFDMGDRLMIGFKKDEFYGEKGYFFNIASGTLEEMNDASEILSLMEQGLPAETWGSSPEIILYRAEQPGIYGAYRIDDSLLGILASFTDKAGDLWYGVYDTHTLKMTQMMLFGDGSGNEVVLQDRLQEFLFETGGYRYYIREPRTLLEWERAVEGAEYKKIPDAAAQLRRELVRTSEGGGKTEVLDNLAILYEGNEPEDCVFLAGERIIFKGAASGDMVEFKRESAISIGLDGSDRRVAETKYGEFNQLVYDNGYIYYEGFSKDGGFPRPVYRLTPDFKTEVKAALYLP